MSYDFVIPPAPVNSVCKLSFHEYSIYDSVSWTNSGNLAFDQPSGNFIVIPKPTTSGLYSYNSVSDTWSVVNFNPSVGSAGTMRYDQATNTITLI